MLTRWRSSRSVGRGTQSHEANRTLDFMDPQARCSALSALDGRLQWPSLHRPGAQAQGRVAYGGCATRDFLCASPDAKMVAVSRCLNLGTRCTHGPLVCLAVMWSETLETVVSLRLLLCVCVCSLSATVRV